jgi:hypothetical protein
MMTVCAIDLSNAGMVRLNERQLPDSRVSGRGEIQYAVDRFTVAYEELPITDARMQPVWGGVVYRLVFTDRAPAREGQWNFSIR